MVQPGAWAIDRDATRGRERVRSHDACSYDTVVDDDGGGSVLDSRAKGGKRRPHGRASLRMSRVHLSNERTMKMQVGLEAQILVRREQYVKSGFFHNIQQLTVR